MSEQATRVESYEKRETNAPSYWNDRGIWYLFLPITGRDDWDGLLATLANHVVEEHQDGTISATPSILVWDHVSRRHGYLARGIWTECE